jgi:hypothetical protein
MGRSLRIRGRERTPFEACEFKRTSNTERLFSVSLPHRLSTTSITLGCLSLLLKIIGEPAEFIGNVWRTQSKFTQRSSGIAEKRW